MGQPDVPSLGVCVSSHQRQRDALRGTSWADVQRKNDRDHVECA